MAFVPNTADPIPIVLHHTPSDTASPSLLYPGEAAVCHGPTHTKMWIGDGTTNRLFLSTNPADSPLLNQSVLGGPFLPLSGGTLASPGDLTLDGGTLTVSGASPAVTWDRTGIDPAQWTMYASSLQWRIEEGTTRLFQFDRNDAETPPIYECQFLEIVRMAKALAVNGPMQAIGGLTAWALQSDGQAVFNGDTYICNVLSVTDNRSPGVPPLVNFYPDSPVTGPQTLGAIRSSGFPGVFNTTDPGFSNATVVGALIRFGATQEWERDIVGTWPTATSDVLQLGAQIEFFVSENGGPAPYRAMTLEQDGTLRLSSAQPSVVWDKTSADPRQWSLLTGDGIGETFWGLHDDDDWRFWVNRTLGPPVSYIFYINDPTTLASWLRVNGYISCAGGITADSRIVSQGGEFLSDWSSDNPVSAPVFATQRMRDTGNIETGDVIGAVEFHSREQGGGTRRGAMIQAVATENHTVNVVGTELQFFTAANGSGGSGTPMMTLGQDANLTVVGSVTASGTLLTSDPDLKDNIAQAPPGALAKVCELPVIDYRWKHGRDSKLHRGFSADDVRRVMGEDSGCSAEGAYSLADMNAYLWRAVQELSAKVQELEQRIH